ncbi:hypothetical protein [Photobacterium sp. J15]|uniref:hypothetical protein n=1 Tax=Photobacterium sp. J15 TaxID=265901 RepID=UPI0007E318E8|nr:hypothetical protein [Photobacterium sp. J15]
MSRILILGNSGSGKTWLAAALAENNGSDVVNLDSVFWMPGGYNQKRSEEQVAIAIEEIKQASDWVVEGVFGALIEPLVECADMMIYLDFQWQDCYEALLSRGSESSKQLDPEAADANFQALLTWASQYEHRHNKNSREFHQRLYQSFEKDKYRLLNRNDVNQFVKDFGASI